MCHIDTIDLLERTHELLVEILLVGIVLCRRPLDPVRAMLIESLGSPIGVGPHRLEEIHFRAWPEELSVRAHLNLICPLPTTGLFSANPRS